MGDDGGVSTDRRWRVVRPGDMTTRKWGRSCFCRKTEPMHEILQERIFNAPDVCLNCHRRVRVERERPNHHPVIDGAIDYTTPVSVEEATWARDPQTTTVEYGPAEYASESKGIWCACGVEGSYVRIWNDIPVPDDGDPDVDDEQFRELVQATIRVLESKGVSLDRLTFARHALEARREGQCVTESLSAGVSHAVAKAEVASRTRATA